MNKIRLVFLLTVLVATIQVVQAQESPGDTELTPDFVQARIQVLRDAGAPEGGTPDGGKTTLDVYQEVMNFLRDADAHAAAEKTYVESLTTAPQLESEIRARMDSQEYQATVIDADRVDSMSRGQIERDLSRLRVDLVDALASKDTLDKRIASEPARAPAIQSRLEEIELRLAEIQVPVLDIRPDLDPSDYEANQWAALAESKALTAERRRLEAQLASQPARFSRRKAQSEELSLIVDGLEFQVKALESELKRRDFLSESETTVDLDPEAPGYEAVQSLLAENQQLRERNRNLNAALAFMNEEDRLARQKSEALGKQLESVQQIVELSENSSSLGHLLMTHWHQIDYHRPREIDLEPIGEIGEHVIQRARFEEMLASLASTREFARQLLKDEETEVSEAALEAAIELARARRDLLTSLISIETKLINSHGSIDRTNTGLDEQFKLYTQYLGSRILWVPSHPSLSVDQVLNISEDLASVWAGLRQLRLTRLDLTTSLLMVLILVSMLFRSTIKAYADGLSAKTRRRADDSIWLTFQVMMAVVLRSAAAPFFLILLGGALDSVDNELVPYFSLSLTRSAIILFIILLFRVSCEEQGLGRWHFGWSNANCNRIHDLTTRLLIWSWPLMFLAAFSFQVEVGSVNVVFGRLVFSIAMVVFSFILISAFSERLTGSNKLNRWGLLALLAVILVAVFLVIAAFLGYIYSAYILFQTTIFSLLLVTGLVFLYNVLKRWVVLGRNQIRYREWLASFQASGEDSPEEDPDIDEQDFYSLSSTVEQLLSAAAIVVGLLGLAYIWSPLFSALEAMERVTLWTISGTSQGEAIITSITLASIAKAIVVGFATFYGARSLPGLVGLALRSRSDMSPGSRYAVIKLMEYTIFGIGVIAILSILGLQWNRLQWLVAALGVGIGFGLQEIIANFISGLIILFERPIRVGDVVTVGESSGEVARVRIRATTIRDFEGKELLVPNKEFVTGRLLNWTLSDPKIRLDLDVGIAYGSDTRRASLAIEDILQNHPQILREPQPWVVFSQFGDSSLNMRARFFIDDPELRVPLISELHHRIYERLAEEGITIAFPQLDVHLDRD